MTQPQSEPRPARAEPLARAYVPSEFEHDIYERWLAADVFAPDGSGSTADPDLPPFVIIQPPPNITGSLHLGHAQRTTVEDLMIRHARMLGRPTLFLPGLDHASIAAQFVLDGILAKEGESRASLGRERYLERMQAFVAETREVILTQQRRLGGSCDWSRLRYTMDEGSAKAVRTAFERLYRDGLAYRTEALDQLVPRLPDERQRPRGDPHARDGDAVAGPLPPDRRGDRRAGSRRHGHRRDDAPRDDPRRHRGRRASRRPALRVARGPPRPDPVRRARRPGHRGRRRRPGVRDGRGEDHAGARPRRLRDGPPPRPRDADDPRRRGAGRRHAARPTTASTATRPGPRSSTALAGSRRPRRGAAARDGHRSLPAQRRRRRAAAEDAVVRPHGAARRGGARGDALGRDAHPPGAVREDLGALDDQHPRLERVAPAVVGPPDPGLVLPGRPRHGERGRRTVQPPARCARRPASRARPGPGHLRHLVQLGAVAVLDARLARPDRRPAGATTRARSWRRATTSCSSGSPG